VVFQDGVDGGGDALFRPAVQYDMRAFRCQRGSDCQANASGGSAHNSYLPFESKIHLILPFNPD